MSTAELDHAPLSLPGGIERSTEAAACAAYEADAHAPRGHRPRAVLKARSTEDVVRVLEWANGSGAGIVPVSSTGQRRRADTVPQRENVCMLDLSAMNKLVHADGRDRIVIVEPGVDFGSIDKLLAPHALRALRPLLPRAGKSLIASYLEREPLIAANDHWDVQEPFGGTHLVLGNGRSSPTGTAAIEGTVAEQLAKGHRHMVAAGPSNIDFLRVVQGAQGTLAVMTWAAVYCERIPTLEDAWFCSADALEPVLDVCREFLHRRLGNALFIVDRVQLALMLARDRGGFISLLPQLPAWTAFVSVSATRMRPQEKMAWQTEDVRRCAQTHGVRLEAALGGVSAREMSQRLRQAEPQSFRDRAFGAHRELFFVQQLNRVGQYVDRVKGVLAQGGAADAADSALGVYVQPTTQGVNCHIEFTWAHAPGGEHRRGDELWHQAAQRCAEADAFFSRPYGRWAEFAYAGEASSRFMMKMAKTIIDPKGVMNPGRLPY